MVKRGPKVGPAASASPGYCITRNVIITLLEMLILSFHLERTESETLGWGGRKLCLNKLSRFCSLLKFENHCSTLFFLGSFGRTVTILAQAQAACYSELVFSTGSRKWPVCMVQRYSRFCVVIGDYGIRSFNGRYGREGEESNTESEILLAARRVFAMKPLDTDKHHLYSIFVI